MRNRSRAAPILVLLLGAALVVSGFRGNAGAATVAESGNSVQEIRPLIDLMEVIEANYAFSKPLKTKEIMDAALVGMVRGLDRYSEFLDQEKYKDLQDDTRGHFEGVGIAIGIVNNRLQVIAPIEGTPADEAGLLGGDVIAYIDGVPTDGMNIMDAVHRIKGPSGTKVTLTILREGEPPADVAIRRAKITPVNIRECVMDGIGYVTIRGFSEDTSQKLDEALSRFRQAGVRGIILDLRSNPGGLLKEAYKVADLFLPRGHLIVSTEGRDPAQQAKYYSTRKPRLEGVPLAVLTNEHSASASEIVAGALKDWGRAIVVGRRTFGKASVQSIMPISRSGSQALRITVAHYYTPDHVEIHESGIEPDVELPPSRSLPALRRLQERGAFKKLAEKMVDSGLVWVDPAELRKGLLAPAPRQGGEDKFEARLAGEFVRWMEERGMDVSDGEWENVREEAVQNLRIEVMRKVKGEEAARRYAVEFDPEVATAVSILKLAAAPGR